METTFLDTGTNSTSSQLFNGDAVTDAQTNVIDFVAYRKGRQEALSADNASEPQGEVAQQNKCNLPVPDFMRDDPLFTFSRTTD